VAFLVQAVGEVGSDEAGAAGDQDLHLAVVMAAIIAGQGSELSQGWHLTFRKRTSFLETLRPARPLTSVLV
jgi:hypothetical protein